jgi:hypothetical protein
VKAILSFLFFTLSLYAYDFEFFKKDGADGNNTLLVIGGIHGNEPGGYYSADILARRYKIKSGHLWVIPNLNSKSIQADQRGVNGDMNRKFADIDPKDPDFKIVTDVKKILLEKQVTAIINLHDGHGFYREKDMGTIFNPKAWGQTCVIDQCEVNGTAAFGEMDKIANLVKKRVNESLIDDDHIFNVKNTNTKFDDEEMRHSLTFFAITHNKPAFAIETSKHLSTVSQKVFYQLNALETFMSIMGIKYERDFNLTQADIKQMIEDDGNITINGAMTLDLNNIKKSLSFIPIKSSNNQFQFTSSIGSIKTSKRSYEIYVGSKKITKFVVQKSMPCKLKNAKVRIIVDGKPQDVNFASEISVKDDFKVEKSKKYRVNVIGYTTKGNKDESEVDLDLKSLNKTYALDNKDRKYRIEFYDRKDFCGMIVVNFR